MAGQKADWKAGLWAAAWVASMVYWWADVKAALLAAGSVAWTVVKRVEL
jgi:hypothetical protein